MIYRRHTDAKEFYQKTIDTLMLHEAQNSIPLGNVVTGNKGGEPDGWRNVKNWYMATVSDRAGMTLLVAIMTPPFNMTLYERNNQPNDEALQCLCKNIFNENISVPGVLSENGLAERFAKAYAHRMGIDYRLRENLRIYTLGRVDGGVPAVGKVRNAEEKDLAYLPYWHAGFYDDCHMGTPSLDDSLVAVRRAIQHKMLFVLEDEGTPVSMAAAQREIITGRCVGMVYTPPYFRKNGYASSCVAQVSQIVLDMGYKYVSLFTNLANPISNSIYQKIGYKPLCDYNDVRFSAKGRL